MCLDLKVFFRRDLWRNLNLTGFLGPQTVLWVGLALLGGAAFTLARLLMKEEEARAAQENLDDLRGKPVSNPLIKAVRPILNQYLVPMIRGKKFWERYRPSFRRWIIAGGLRDEMTIDEFIAFKCFNIVFFPVVFGFLKSMSVVDFSVPTILSTGILGFFYPDFWVKSKVKARQKKILNSMPFIVDLLALSTEAGLDFMGSIGKVVEKSAPGPLVEELEQVLKEIKVGASRSEALREMAKRIDMPEMNSFVSILISAEQMGASIGKVLRQQTEQIRIERFLRAEKAGAAAAQKLIIPIIFIIMPAVMLMVMGPFLIDLAGGGSF